MNVNVLESSAFLSLDPTMSTLTEEMLYPNYSIPNSTYQEAGQNSLTGYTSPRPNFDGWNESSKIGFGIPNSSESTHIVNYCIGVILLIIGLAGTAGNGLVFYIFTRYKLRGGGGPLILSLASGDFFVSVLHVLPAYSSFNNQWAFGTIGCNFYAASVGFCGIASLLTMTAIAADRFGVIVGRPHVWLSGIKCCAAIWTASAALTFPPLFGWSRYCLEGFGTSCSWDYASRDLSNRLYYIFLLTAGFVFPVSIITTSYLGILRVVCKQKSQLSIACKDGATLKPKKSMKNDIKTAKVICKIIILFLVAWTPYAVISLIGQFGDESKPLSPMATAIPAIFAKTSVVINPIVYGLSHPNFRSAVRTLRAEGFASKVYRSYPKKNNNSCYQYNGSLFTYASRFTSAAKLKDLYNGTRHGSGERLRRQTSRQRETKRRYSPSTRMMSDMTNSSNPKTVFVVEGNSILQKHLVSLENSEILGMQDIESISEYCDVNSAPELHGHYEAKKSKHSSVHIMSKSRKKQVRSSRTDLEDNRRFKVQAYRPDLKKLQKPLSRSENCLDLTKIAGGQLKSSMRNSKSLCTCERIPARVTISTTNRVYEHNNFHSKNKGRNAVRALSVSFGSDDCIGIASGSEQDEGTKKSSSQFTSNRTAHKRKGLSLGSIWSKRYESQNKCKTFEVNKEELPNTKKGFPPVPPLERPASAVYYDDKMRIISAPHKSGGSDPMGIHSSKKNEKKSTLRCWGHKILEKTPLAKKIFWRRPEKQVVHYHNSSGTSNGDYPSSTNNDQQDYYSSFI